MKYYLILIISIFLYGCFGKSTPQNSSIDSTSANTKIDSMHAESIFMKLWDDQKNKPNEVKLIESSIAKYDSVSSEICKILVAYNATGDIVKLELKTENETGDLVTFTNQYYKNSVLFYVENLADVLPDPQSSIIFKGFVKKQAIEKITISKTMVVNGVLIDYPEIRADQIEFIENPVEKVNENRPRPVNHSYVGE